MQIVIDISEEDYKKATDHLRIFNEKALKEDFMNATLRNRLEIALLHGNILPQGHGRLIDADKLAKEILRAWNLWEKKGEDCYLFADVLTPMLISQPTIIESEE